jgi:hypothetical protein
VRQDAVFGKNFSFLLKNILIIFFRRFKMFKKFTYLAISIAALLLMTFVEAKADTPIPVAPYSYNTYYGYVIYNSYFFTANRSFIITRFQVPNEYGGNQPQSVELYQLNTAPSYPGQFYYDQVFYGAQNYNYSALWSVRAWGGGNGPIPVNQGTWYPTGGTVQSISIQAGQTYLICGNIGNYYQSFGYGYGFQTNIGGTPMMLWWAEVLNGYYMYSYWSYYSYMYPNYTIYIGRVIFWYTLPVYITAVQAAGGTIAPAGVTGPFNQGDNANVTYTITANAGKWITDILVNGASIGQGSITNRSVMTYHFGVINSDQTITAVFGNKITATGFGVYMNPTGTTYYAPGANPTYMLTPFTGARISTIVATPSVGVAVNIPVQGTGGGQTVALGQPGYPFAALNKDWTLVATAVVGLTTSTTAHGSVTPAGFNEYPFGNDVWVVATPDPGYKVNQFYIDGVDVLDPSSPGYPSPRLDFSSAPVIRYRCTMTQAHEAHATFYAYEITPFIAGSGTGGTIDPPTKVRVFAHAQFPFIITPDLDYHVAYIGVTDLNTGNTKIFDNLPPHGGYTVLFQDIMTDYRLSTSFTIDEYQITIKNAKTSEGGKVFPTGDLSNSSPDGIMIVNSGTSQNFSIEPDLGWKIQNVFLDGDSLGPKASLALNKIRADHVIDARFAQIQFTITATAGNHGTIVKDGWTKPVPAGGAYPVIYGDNAKFIITPDHGYKIGTIMKDGTSVNLDPEQNFYYVTSDHTITASFIPATTYTITATAGTGGTISPSGSVSVYEGDDQKFDFTPNAGYEIADVLVDQQSQGKITTYTFQNVSGNHTIEVTFNPIITLGLVCQIDDTKHVSGQPFSITITSIDQSNQQPSNPPAPLNVTITAGSSSQGTLGGTLTGTIPITDNKVTITGIVYTHDGGEANVQLKAGSTGLPDCMMTTNFLAAEPTVQDNGINIDTVKTYYGGKDGTTALSQVVLSWIQGDGTKRLVVIKPNNLIDNTEFPNDGQAYNAAAAYGSGQQLGTNGCYAVYSGADNMLTVTNLIEGTLYYVRIYAFNGDNALTNYNTNTGTNNPKSFNLVGVDETNVGTGFMATNVVPNPAYNDIKFELNVFTPSAFTIEVVDMGGRIVSSVYKQSWLDAGSREITVPLSKLSSGSYVLKIYNGTDFAYQVFTIVR